MFSIIEYISTIIISNLLKWYTAMSMKKIIFSAIVLLLISDLGFSQVRDYELGSVSNSRRGSFGGFYDYSDPESINIKVSVWGFVKYPGRYFIPDRTTILDLMSFVGGPLDDSNLDELRIYRLDENNNEIMLPVDYNDVMWEENLDSKYRKVPDLKASDILVVPGEPRLYFMDWFSIGLSVFSALISLTILILNIQNN